MRTGIVREDSTRMWVLGPCLAEFHGRGWTEDRKGRLAWERGHSHPMTLDTQHGLSGPLPIKWGAKPSLTWVV